MSEDNHTEGIQNTSNNESNDTVEPTLSKTPRMSRKRHQEVIMWRRNQVATLLSQGFSPSQIQAKLQFSFPTISKDIGWLKKESRENLNKLIEDTLPFRHTLRVAAVDKVITELWQLYERETENSRRKSILDSITQALQVQASIDSDPAAIDRAIKTVAKIKEKVKGSKRESSEESVDGTTESEQVVGTQ